MSAIGAGTKEKKSVRIDSRYLSGKKTGYDPRSRDVSRTLNCSGR